MFLWILRSTKTLPRAIFGTLRKRRSLFLNLK